MFVIYEIGILLLIFLLVNIGNGGVAPPHWVDLKRNPCASRPFGWQLLYWPPDQSCYKIFQLGYPCPDTMELTPSLSKDAVSECKCPPGTAQLTPDSPCYSLFGKEPCGELEYFAPDVENKDKSKRIGICKKLKKCPSSSQIWWPHDGLCYQKLTRGPCSEGKLLIRNNSSNLPMCHCDSKIDEMKPFYWALERTCHELYTRGPCSFKGHLFLPGGKCGCNADLPHYHKETAQCYKLGDIGPCPTGHQFKIVPHESPNARGKIRGKCVCKENYVLWQKDQTCYRLYTQGPCQNGEFLINETTCIKVPCQKGHLYFPIQDKCYRIGIQGPCNNGHVVTFDYTVRPSIDGISYHGVCHCSVGNNANDCQKEYAVSVKTKQTCDHGKVLMNNICHMLYTQGPCDVGQWLTPKRTPKWQLWQDEEENSDQESIDKGLCQCRPGYSEVRKMQNTTVISITCHPPAVNLATYLNANVNQFDAWNKLILR